MKKNICKTSLKILSVGILLYLFLVSISLMGAAFKGFGKGFAENLIRTTSNPFIGLFIGILATSLVQSSSTTTSVPPVSRVTRVVSPEEGEFARIRSALTPSRAPR